MMWTDINRKFPKNFVHWLQRSGCKHYCERFDKKRKQDGGTGWLIRSQQQLRHIHRDLRKDRDFQFFYKSYRIRMLFTDEHYMSLWVGETSDSFDKWGNSTLCILEQRSIPENYNEFLSVLKLGLEIAKLQEGEMTISAINS